MAVIKVRTKNKVDIDKKPRVFFTCHQDDFEKYFDKACNDIFKSHDCAVYYTKDMTEIIADEDKETYLGRNNLFVIPVSLKLLTTPNRAMDEDFPYAMKEHIPVLPIMMEPEINDLYSSPYKFGELQYLNPYSTDLTEISYEEKLKKYLESVLISDEMAKRVRVAFDAYIFLSYRKKDRRYANELMRLIHNIPECRDIAIWFDEFLTPGESFKENIERILNDCQLFTLLVTPQLFEKVIDESGKERDNYVMGVELPAARKKKEEKGTEILAVQMEETDRAALIAGGIEDYVSPKNEDIFRTRILTYISKIAISANKDNLEHDFLIGLAYLEGIDVEVNRRRALELIKGAAEANFPEAIATLISMYTDGVGVSRNQVEALKWSEKLADYYFKKIFSKRGIIKSRTKLAELFYHYKNKRWENTIRFFLLKVDKTLTFNLIRSLYEVLMSFGICEYTLFFETCREMTQHQEKTQIVLVTDILKKSVNDTYPPYGPLFWYVPEYELYEVALLSLDQMKEDIFFAKMLALVRDVCWIFGQKNLAIEVTTRIDSTVLYEAARKDLFGIRMALCELFYVGNTTFDGGNDIYPRCFNVGEVISQKDTGIGLWERMSEPFEDELGLYEHLSYNELDGELIGFVSCPYHKPNIEKLFNEKNMYKVKGLALTQTINTIFTYISIYRKNITVLYFPENCIKKSRDSLLQMNLIYENYWSDTHLSYIRRQAKLVIPGHITDIEPYAFMGFYWMEEIVFSEGVLTIGRKAFQGCDKLSKIVFPSTITQIEPRLFLCFNLKNIVAPRSIYDVIVERFEKKANKIREVTELDNEWLEITVSNVREGKDSYSVSLKRNSSLYNGLTDVKVKNTFLQDETFEGNQDIQSVKLPSRLRKIFPRTFKDCVSLVNILMPNDLEVIGRSAFEGCTALSRIFLPESLKSISNMAFKGCANLIKLFLPNSLLNIGSEAFAGCISLREIQLPPNLVYVAPNAFIGCKSLVSVKLPVGFTLPLQLNPDAQLKYYQPRSISQKCLDKSDATDVSEICSPINSMTGDINEVYISGDTLLSKKQFAGRKDITSVVIGEGITNISKYCFSGCVNLHTVILPSTVTKISEGAFINCHNLTNIEFPYGLKSINESAFANCRRLFHVKFSKSLLQIGGQAFCGCISLESIELLSTIRRIGARAFLDCRALQQIRISANFRGDLEKIFGDIDPLIVCFIF